MQGPVEPADIYHGSLTRIWPEGKWYCTKTHAINRTNRHLTPSARERTPPRELVP